MSSLKPKGYTLKLGSWNGTLLDLLTATERIHLLIDLNPNPKPSLLHSLSLTLAIERHGCSGFFC